MKSTFSQAQQLKSWSVQHRRYLHQYPEISLEEQQTAQYCAEVLTELGYQIKPCWGYGFTADLINPGATKTIGLRAEMDALSMQEKNQHDFISKHAGVAHMCGHDAHMTIALTAAKLLQQQRQQLRCNVRFLFQPCEEKPPSGAVSMIEHGCLEGVDEVYGLHNDPGTPVGKIRTRVGALTATADIFSLAITGRGCHAARPHDGLDPIYAAAQLINQWQAIIARRINPNHPAILSVTKINAGEAFNVIPDHVSLGGTVRTFDSADRELIQTLMRHSIEALKLQGYHCEFNYIQGFDSIINHAAGVQRVLDAAHNILGAENVDGNSTPEGWGEDFAYYLQHRPGAFYFLGSGNASKGITEPIHSSTFDIDEDALVIGAAIMTELALQMH